MEITSYVVEASFTILDRDRRYDRQSRVFVGRFHEKAVAVAHAKRVQKALRKELWLDDVEVEVLTCWHLRSGQAAAQLVRDIYRYWSKPEPEESDG